MSKSLSQRVREARLIHSKQLRNCQAWVEECEDRETGEIYKRLRSYNTIVACVLDTEQGRTCVKFDYEFYYRGYTRHSSRTTSQQISKFIKELRCDYVCKEA